MAKCTTVYVGDKQTNVKNIDYINSNQDKTTVAIFLNQSGYDVGRSKRATVTNVKNGTTFYIKDTNDTIVYTGIVEFQIANFTNFDTVGEYYLNVDSVNSYNFKIEDNYIATISQKPALDFMAQSRQDVFNTGGNTGYAWRDSHQFSFELHGLCMQYMSNPSYYEGLPYSIPEIDTCEYTELQTQNEPDIIRLFNDIWGYLNTLDEGSEKYQYAFSLAKEMYDKGLIPNDHLKEIIIDVENLYKT